jgi:hypothetical protein
MSAGMLRSGNCHPEIISGFYRVNGFRSGGRNDKTGSFVITNFLFVILNLPCRQAGLVQNRLQTHIGLLDSGPAAGMTTREAKKCHPECISGSYRLNGFRLTSTLLSAGGGRNDRGGWHVSAYCLLLTPYFFFLSLTAYFLLLTSFFFGVMERTNG